MSGELDEKGLEAAKEAFNEAVNNPRMIPCPKCDGKGYHHGFGEDGASPDWCLACGGGQYDIVPGEEDRSLAEAIRAYLAASPSPPMEMGVVAWQVPAMNSTYGQTGWKFINRRQNPEDYEPGEYEALQASLATASPLVTLSSAQSALAAIHLAYRAEHEGLHQRAEHAIARAETAEAQVQRLTEENEALRGQTYLASAEAAEFHRDNAITMWHEEKTKREAAEARIKALEEVLRAVSDTSHLASGKDYYRLPWPIMEKVDSALKENAL